MENQYNVSSFNRLSEISKGYPHIVIDTSFIGGDKRYNRAGRGAFLMASDTMNAVNEFESRGQRVVIIDEVIKEAEEYLRILNEETRLNGASDKHIQQCNLILKLIKTFKGRDIRTEFDEQKRDSYEKIFQMVEDIYWEVILKEKTDFNELSYMANSFGSKLMTDRKIVAISFYLSELGKTLILTRDKGLERVVNRIKTQHENPIPIQRYHLQKKLLDRVDVFTPY